MCGQSAVAGHLFLDSHRQTEIGLLNEVGEAEIILTAECLPRVSPVGIEQAYGSLIHDDGGDKKAFVAYGCPQGWAYQG